jgi:hypothetical protein
MKRIRRLGLHLTTHQDSRVSVYAYGELPNEIALATSEVIAEEEPNALAQCT